MAYTIKTTKAFDKDMARCIMLNTGTHSDLFSKKYKK